MRNSATLSGTPPGGEILPSHLSDSVPTLQNPKPDFIEELGVSRLTGSEFSKWHPAPNAKRRCDLRFPQCSRCMTRSAVCEYAMPPKSVADTRQQITPRTLTRISPHTNTLPSKNTMPICLSADGSFDIGASTNPELFPISSFPFPERMTLRQDQIDFCIGQFKAFIPQLVLQNRSPFIHPDPYQRMPPVVYQDLLGVSAMYCQKSPQNETIIFSMLDSRISSLIRSSKSSSWLIEDYLLGVQVLIIYQIIRLFDGDIRQRAKAEKDLGILEAWTFQLQSTGNIFYNECDAESPYERWVFIESTRRTIIMATMVQAMYSLVKDGFCTSVPLLSTLPVSIDGALWDASEETWWQTTLGFGGDLLTYREFINQWIEGQALYTNTYETILLSACKHNLRKLPLMFV